MKAALPLVAVAFAMAGCVSQVTRETPYVPTSNAIAVLEPTKGSTVSGSVMFAQRGDKVFVNANLKGLKPNAEHGFHIHEKGDCSSGDGVSAGGHFNPGAKAHGISHGADHHAGDMPNVKADAQGNASAQFEVTGLAIGAGATDIVGKGLIVHRDPDDYQAQPAGNAGPRVACAVIRKA